MRIRAKYFDSNGLLSYGEIGLENGVFTEVRLLTEKPPSDTPSLLPALCDIHTHGNSGFDFSDGDYDGLVEMARFLYRHGVARFSPATMSLPEERLARACENARRFHENPVQGCARLVGITMEGPFLSYEKRGAQSPDYLIDPDYDFYARLQQATGGLIKIVCVAPELPGARAFIQRVSKEAKVALAHTGCDYGAACAGFDAGASHVTHLYNAMSPMHHRAPGPIPAAAERGNVTAELICDGLHVHPAMVRAAYALFGEDRLCLVSDAMAACGMEDGVYELGAQKVAVREGRATLADGTIAGSTANLWDCMKNAVTFGIPPASAVRMASANPLRLIGEAQPAIRPGEKAAHVLCTEQLEILDIYT